jgi:hypothetical protein
MIRFVLVLGVLAAASAANLTAAIQTPDFSGAWSLASYRGSVEADSGGDATRLTERPATGGGGAVAGVASFSFSGGGGARRGPAAQALTIRQAGGILTIEVPDDATRTTTYRLDGTESVNTLGNVTFRTVSRWDGSRLVTEGTQTVSTSAGDVSAAFKEVRWITEEGVMAIETTRTPEGRDPTTSRAEYSRSS